MAKHCTVCNQDYADDLAACPHCASAKQTHLAGRGEDRTTQLIGRSEERTTQLGEESEPRPRAALPSDSAIDLGPVPTSKPATGAPVSKAALPSDSVIDLGPVPTSKPATGDAGGAPMSDDSMIAWSALVEEPDTGESKEIKIDSPSDADLLAHGAADSPPATPAGSDEELVGELEAKEPVVEAAETGAEAEMVELAGSPPQPVAGVSDSTVDLGGPLAEVVEDAAGVIVKKTAPEESEVFVAELASDASRVDLVGDSGLELSEGEVVEVADEGVEAGIEDQTPAAELAEEAALDAAAAGHESSAVDLGATPIVHDASLSAQEVAEVAPVPEGSGLDLEGLPVPAASTSELHPPSESSVDLGAHVEVAASSPSGTGGEEMVGSGIDVEGIAEPTAQDSASGLALQSLLSDSASSEAADDEGVAEEAESEESVHGAVEEPAVSETEVNDLLAGLEQPATEDEAGVTAEEAAEIAEGEQAIAAAESEEAAEAAAEEEAAEPPAEAEDEQKPAKPVKPRSRIPALAGGTLLGILLGAGGMIGAQALMGPSEKAKAPAPPSAPAAPPVTFDTFEALLRNGDWAEAEKKGIGKFQAAKANELVARGEYHLGNYLKNVGGIKNADDPALLPALQDLQKAADMNDAAAAVAIYDLAFIKELAGQLPQARAEYAKGAQKFQNQPELKQRFEAAIERVDWKASLKGGGAAMLPLPDRLEDRAAVLAMLLVALQQPLPAQPAQPAPAPQQQGQPPAAAKEDTKEAGFEFWQAAKLAREGKFGDAIRAIDRARKLHDERRFKRLRKAQNPLSDPAEDIFLRCCDELKMYWQLENRLRDGGYLTDKNTSPEALQALLQKTETSAAVVKDATDKLVAAKVIGKDDDVSKGLDRLITDKKKADDAVADLTAKLKTAADENTKRDGDLKAEKKKSEKLETDLTSAKEENKKLVAAKDALDATLKKIAAELADAKFLDPKGKPNVSEAVKKAVDVAKMKDPQGMVRQHRDDIAQLAAALKQRWRPEEMLPLWLLLLDENRGRPDLTSLATKDVERVKMDPRATPVQKAEAEIVHGLALRNAEEFDKAKMVLEAARGSVDEGQWAARANAALKEVSNPAAYFAQQAQRLYDQGRMTAALAVLERAMKVLSAKEQGKLLAKRSLIELDAARSKAKGALPSNDPLIVAARKDAAEAVKAGLAEGHYAAGRIAEELGQVDAAIQSYRAAVAAHGGDKLDAEGARYRMALARALLLPRQARPGQPAMAPPPAGEKVGWRDPAPYPARHFEDLKQLVLMLTLGLQAPLLPGEEPGLEEAEKLADDVLRAEAERPGTVPFNVLAQAQAVKGRWTLALQTYLEGIRPMLPREYGNGLVYLILNHPRLKRPDSLRIPNPLEAEKHFAAGLNFYFDREYAKAEREFLLTLENDANDARYFYFLGLSRLAQNRSRDAYDDFDEGALLEHQNRPSPAAVSESLERIQGRPRRIINEFRKRL